MLESLSEFLILLGDNIDSFGGLEGSKHQMGIIDIRVERGCVAFRITKVGGVGMPWSQAVTNGAIDNRGVERLVMEIMMKPTPILSLNSHWFEIAKVREVVISTVTTAIGVSVSVFVPGTIEAR